MHFISTSAKEAVLDDVRPSPGLSAMERTSIGVEIPVAMEGSVLEEKPGDEADRPSKRVKM
jgi:hypothetical protein